MKKVILAILLLSLNWPIFAETSRWYSDTQVRQGEQVYRQNCISCHGDKAAGLIKDWRQPLADGSYAAPPLNGSAHAWHHTLRALFQTINNGGTAIGGKMPAFRDKLSNDEKLATLAYIQNFWNEDIYSAWVQRGGLK
jgi:mono/diheme cytochrome c family protein